jgi:hypothetical protein
MRTRVLSLTVALGLGALVLLPALPALPASGRGSHTLNVKALTNSINRAKHLTYLAQYTALSNGQKTTVTIAQAPPKSNFSTQGGSVINNGKTTYYCSTTTGTPQCLSVSGANPLLGLEGLFSPTVALGALAEAKQGLVSRFLGIKVTSSSATFAGQSSTCVTVSLHGKGGKYCVTKQGLLSYSGSSSSNFQLTKYSATPPASLFSLPAGATTATLPGGASIP